MGLGISFILLFSGCYYFVSLYESYISKTVALYKQMGRPNFVCVFLA